MQRGDAKSPFNHKLHVLFIIPVVAFSVLSFMCMMAQLTEHLKYHNVSHQWRYFDFSWENGGDVKMIISGGKYTGLFVLT